MPWNNPARAALPVDDFPANETFISDQNGTGVFLGVSGADGGPFTSLPFANERPMSSFGGISIQIYLDFWAIFGR